MDSSLQQPGLVNEIVANIEADQTYYFRLERRRSDGGQGTDRQLEDDGDCKVVVKEVVLTKRVKSCMKGVYPMKPSRKRVSFGDSAGA